MTFIKLLVVAAVSALCFSSSALAGRVVISASSHCRAVSIGYSKVSNDKAIAKVSTFLYLSHLTPNPFSSHLLMFILLN